MNLRMTISVSVLLTACAAAQAADTPDPKLEAFVQLHRKVQTDPGGATEADVLKLLALGKELGRPYAASLAVKGYLSQRATPSPTLLLASARNALLVGDHRAAAARFKSYLRTNGGGASAGDTAATLYAVLIDLLGDTEDAYQFMTQYGARLRTTPAARRFDGWYVRQARSRRDTANLARMLALIFAEKMPIEQERLFFWEHLDWLLTEISRASADQFDALPHLRKLAGLIRDSKHRTLLADLYVANLAFKAGSAGKEAKALTTEFEQVIAAAQALFKALATADTLQEIVHTFAGGSGSPGFDRNAWAQQLQPKQAFFVNAFSRLSDADRRQMISWQVRGVGYVAHLLASRSQWTDLAIKHAAVFAGNDDVRLLPLEPRADEPAVLAAQARTLKGIRSYDAAVINSLAAGGDNLLRCVDHLVGREMWHLPANQVVQAFESGIWPVWRGSRLAGTKGDDPDKSGPADQHTRAFLRLGATGIEKTALSVFYPDAAAGYLRAVWDASEDKSAIIPRLEAFDWAPWTTAERKRVLASVHGAYKVWSTALARQARQKDAKVDPKLLKQVQVIGKAFDAALTRRSPDPAKAPNPLCRAVADAALAARAGRDSKAYADAARAAYPHVAQYDAKKVPCGRQILTFLLDTEYARGGKRDVDWLCEVLTDQLGRYDARGVNTRIDEVIDLVMANTNDRVVRVRKREVMAKVHPVFAKAMLAQVQRGQLPPKLFAWFRTTRSGPYWKELGWGQEVMETIVAKRLFHQGDYRPFPDVPSATVSYMLLISREFPGLQSKYPAATFFDDLFVEEAGKSGFLDWHYWEYGRDEQKKVANLAARMLAGYRKLPFGYNGEPAAYERAHFWDWQARAYNAEKAQADAMSAAMQAAYGRTRFDAYARGRQYFSGEADVALAEGRKEFFAHLARYLDEVGRQPDREPLPYLGQLTQLGQAEKLTKQELNAMLGIFPHHTPPTYSKNWQFEKLGGLTASALLAQGRADEIFALAPYLWKIAQDTADASYARALAELAKALLAQGHSDLAHVLASEGLGSGEGGLLPSDARAALQSVRSQALAQVGGVIPVARSDPRYPVYAAQACYLTGRFQQARELYVADRDRAVRMYKELDPRFCIWLIEQDTRMGQHASAEALARLLSEWFDRVGGDFEPEVRGDLALAFADIFFARQEYPIASARYKSIAAAKEFQTSRVKGQAELKLAEVYRLTKRFDEAMAQLDQIAANPDKALAAQAFYQQALVKYDQEEYHEARAALERVFVISPDLADARILEGRVFLKLKRVELATEIEAGTPTRKKFLVPGTPLAVTLIDRNLTILGSATHVQIRAWTDSGDEEHFNLNPFGDSRTKFKGRIQTALAPLAKRDGTLQVLGGEQVHFDFAEAVKQARNIRVASHNTLTVVTDAQVLASSGRILSKAEQEREALEELIRRQLTAQAESAESEVALATVRQGNQIKPGNPVNVRVVDPDRSITAKADRLAVALSTSSGDSIQAFELTESGTHTGLFEGAVPTASGHATAYASDSEVGKDPNFAISSKDYGPWIAQADNVRPKFFSIDLNDNVAPAGMRIEADVALRKLKEFVVQTSLNGRDFTPVAAWPKKLEPWDGSPRLQLVKFVGRRTPQRLDEVISYLRTGCISEGQKKIVVKPASTPSLRIDLYAGGHASKIGLGSSQPYLARMSAAFYQPNRETRTFRLVPRRSEGRSTSSARFFLVVDGRAARADAGDDETQSLSLSLGKGPHVVEIYVVSHYSEWAEARLLWDIDKVPYMAACPAEAFDTVKHPQIREGIERAVGTVTADKENGAFDVTFPEPLNVRVIRLMLVDFETDAPAIRRVSLTDRAGKALLPIAQDFMKLRQDRTLQIVPGDTITVRYEDPTVVTEGKEVQSATLTATYSNAEISACFVEYQTNAQGDRTARYIPMRRFGPEDKIQVLINDPDMDGTEKLDTVKFTANSTGGQPVTLTALETSRHSGVFLGSVFPVAGAPKRASELTVKPGDDVILTYLDAENTDPGIPWQRSCLIEQVWFKTPELIVYNVRSEPVEVEPDAEAAPVAARPGKLADTVVDVVPATRLMVASASEPPATQPAEPVAEAPAAVLIGGPCLVEVLFPTIAKSPESKAEIFVQTLAGRKAFGQPIPDSTFELKVPGTIRLTARPGEFGRLAAPPGYTEVIVQNKRAELGSAGGANEFTALDDGRFSFVVPIELGKLPPASLAMEDEQELRRRGERPRLMIRGDDELFIGLRYVDAAGQPHWVTRRVVLDADGLFDVTDRRYQQELRGLYIGQKAYLRVIDGKRDLSDEPDEVTVELSAASGSKQTLKLRETFGHSGVFKGLIGFAHAGPSMPGESGPSPAEAGAMAREGGGTPELAVKYGDTVTAVYQAATRDQRVERRVDIFKGSDGVVTPFSKRFKDPAMAIRTQFMIAEAYLELAKRHRKLGEQSAARREIAQGKKLLEEAIRDYPADETRAQAEYLLADLALEFANDAKNETIRRNFQAEAIGRYSNIVASYPQSEYAPKAQYRKALTMEKMGRFDDACEEYVKLSYRYPNNELVAETIARLGQYFLLKGRSFREEAAKEKDLVKQEAILLKSRKMFKTAGEVLARLGERFPEHQLAGKTAVLSAQSFVYAEEYELAIKTFEQVIKDDRHPPALIAEAMYWCGDSYLKLADAASARTGRRRPSSLPKDVDPVRKAYQYFKRLDWDYPTTKWARYARGRLASELSFEKIEP